MAVVFVVAVLLRQVVPLNTDVSWLLTIGERVLNGERLYVDIVEINPPMAVLSYLPGIALARALGLDAKIIIDGQMLLLTACSLLATWRILRLSPASGNTGWAPLAVWSAAVLTILPMHVYGQREHMATLTFPAGLSGLCASLRWRAGSVVGGCDCGDWRRHHASLQAVLPDTGGPLYHSGGGACAFMANAVCAGEFDRRRCW